MRVEQSKKQEAKAQLMAEKVRDLLDLQPISAPLQIAFSIALSNIYYLYFNKLKVIGKKKTNKLP